MTTRKPPLRPAPLGIAFRTGRGSAIAHHGEIWQGLFVESNGRFRRALVTLPCPLWTSSATFVPRADGRVVVTPAWKTKAQRAGELALARAGHRRLGGRLTIHSRTPPRWGLGSSTSDVLAAIRAVLAATGAPLPEAVIAEIAVQAETASDPIMFGRRAVLFAHQEGTVLEDFGGPLPELEVLGLNTDPTGAGVDTLTLIPPRYTGSELATLQSLVKFLRQAVHTRNLGLVGQVASASARINQRYLPKLHFDRMEHLVACVAGLGLAVAHSGTVVGLLFDPADAATPEKIREARALLAEIGFAKSWRFRLVCPNVTAPFGGGKQIRQNV